MLIPILILSVGAVFAGVVFAPYFIGEHNAAFWGTSIGLAADNHVLHEAHLIKEKWVKFAPLIVTLIGMVLAWFFYVRNPDLPRKLAANKGPLYTFLYNKWFFDEIYDALFVKPLKWLGDLLWKIVDVRIIDGLGPNGAAWSALAAATQLVRTQSGYVYHYAFFMFLGLVGLLTAVVFGWMG